MELRILLIKLQNSRPLLRSNQTASCQENKPPLTADISTGAVVRTTYVERQMRAYAVYEDEVASLSYLNTQATIFFAIASALISFAVGIWTNAAFSTGLTPAGELAARYVSWGLLGLGLIFAAVGGHALYARVRQWENIVRGSRSR